MEQLSHYISAGAFGVVIAGWFVFAATFLLRKRSAPTTDAVHAPRSWAGLILQGLGYIPVWSFQRRPMFSSFTGEYYTLNIVLQLVAILISVASVYLTIAAVRELGKQWSLEARLVEGHDLVMTGPYSLVRHPIYTAMLGKLVATGIVLSVWPVVLAGVAVFLMGTFVRTRFEERLLSGAFGEQFANWKAQVPGLIPFLK
jgi:protein-S-isoprenylcysteine O-methyltransferase Ste14